MHLQMGLPCSFIAAVSSMDSFAKLGLYCSDDEHSCQAGGTDLLPGRDCGFGPHNVQVHFIDRRFWEGLDNAVCLAAGCLGLVRFVCQ